MRFLREHLKEEVNLTSYTKSGVIDVDDVSVRENINILLKGATARSFLTPYIALEKVSKVLANFHIFIPHMTFLEGDHGIEVFDVRQFGMKMGMKDNGEIVTKEAQPYNIYFEYRMNENGMFDIVCKLTERENIEKGLNEAKDDLRAKMMGAGAAMALGASGLASSMAPYIGNKLIPANVDKWEMTHHDLVSKGMNKEANELKKLIDDFKKTGSVNTRLSLERRFKKHFPNHQTQSNLKEALNAAAYVLAEGKRDQAILDSKMKIRDAIKKGSPQEVVDALTKHHNKRVARITGPLNKKAFAANQRVKAAEMDKEANAPSSKSVNESVKKSFK